MKRTHQVENAPERMNDEFSRHLSAAMYSLIKEIVTEVVAEVKEKNPEPPQPSPDSHEYMTRKEVMALLKRCDSTMTKWARRGYLVPCCIGGKYLYRKEDVMKLVAK